MTRYEFVDESIKEADIHPKDIFLKEYSMAKEFVSSIESEEEREDCLICGEKRHEEIFEKWGMKYMICPKTWSISLAQMPSDDIYEEYFYKSQLASFRASDKYQSVVSNHRKELWDNNIEWIEGRVRRYMGMGKYNVIDFGSRIKGWIEALSKSSFVNEVGYEDTLPPLMPKIIEKPEVVCAIDVFQRQTNPIQYMKKIWDKLPSDGILILTCRAGTGFDILTLRGNSETIFPLDHILLPSPNGMEYLLKKCGFEILEISTPGLLDVDYVKNSQNDIPKEQYLQRYIMEQADEHMLQRLQSFLQRNNLSSYLRVVAKKVEVDN